MFGGYPTIVECPECGTREAIYGARMGCTTTDCDGEMTPASVADVYAEDAQTGE